MAKRKRRFVIRTIKNGQVKILGRIFKPTNKWLEYDGRLDGQRWAFGLYWRGDEQLPFVALWGTKEAYVAAYEEETWTEYCETERFTPDMVYSEERKNWYYPWATWTVDGQEAWARRQPVLSV